MCPHLPQYIDRQPGFRLHVQYVYQCNPRKHRIRPIISASVRMCLLLQGGYPLLQRGPWGHEPEPFIEQRIVSQPYVHIVVVSRPVQPDAALELAHDNVGNASGLVDGIRQDVRDQVNQPLSVNVHMVWNGGAVEVVVGNPGRLVPNPWTELWAVAIGEPAGGLT